ncbi:MAG TPA: S9 family peptidase [Bryobacteraceae bacterium]|nr:S9 family peptidase [Bryobacteraceae bacterium]
MSKLGFALLLASAALAQKKPITVDTLREAARERDVPGPAHWAPDGKTFAFEQSRVLRLYLPVGKTSRLIASLDAMDDAAVPETGDLPMEWTNRRARTGGIEWLPDGKSLLYSGRGDLFLIHVESGTWDQLTKTPEAEIDPEVSPDGNQVAFRRGSDLYTLDLATRKEKRLTTSGTPTLINGGLDWVYPEEIGLSRAFWWSPDSKSLAYLQFDVSREPIFPHEDLLKPRALFEPQRYPQAGENNADVRFGVVPAGGGSTRWFDLGDTRHTYLLARAGWMPGSKSVYAVRTNRVQNRLEALALDIESGAAATIFRESDPYWINLKGDLKFLKDGRFLWMSERDGYRHIYLYSNDGKQVKQLTKGNWEVNAIEAVDENTGRLFYTSSEPTHLERHLYSVPLRGGAPHRISKEAGMHSILMAPAGAYYLDRFSNLGTPPITMLREGDGQDIAVYREPDRKLTEEYEFLRPEIVQFQGDDGTPLYGRLIKPAGFQAGRKYPVVVMVYGGPDVALPVRNAWLGVSLEQVLAQRGYVVWQAENRGGSGRGHAFETAIYHKLGSAELADQVAGVKHLLSLGFADSQRVGVRGWSYGGFMTINALLNAPTVFHAGFAGAPVTSWLNYDTIYTERYMGLPNENPDGYSSTALPPRAANLQGKLLVAHNFEDDNVLFQNTLQMANALETAGKQFEMMIYPQKTHAVTGALAHQLDDLTVEFFDRSLK